jgi:glycogen synthase
MEDLRHVAYLRKGELIVMPFFLQNIYEDLKSGVSWSVWPSLYEPFGGVTEFYMSGTPVVARDTGGLADQVVDISEDPANATGILYRERGTGTQEDLENEWKKIQLAASPLERLESRLYREQLGALAFAVCRAIDIYTGYPEIYGRLLANLPGITNKLSWDVSVEKYLSWYDSATMKWEV